jgi:hypothetical protein
MKMMEMHLVESKATIFVNPAHVVLVRNATAALETKGCHVHLSDNTDIVVAETAEHIIAWLAVIDAEPGDDHPRRT